MTLYDTKMMSLLNKLKEYDNQIIMLEKELKALTDQYFDGVTLKQQITLYQLMRSDLNYKNNKKILESKLALLRAERDKYYTDEMVNIQIMKDCI